MRKAAIHEVLRRIRPFSPFHKASHLRSLIASEPKRSIRRHELEEALKEIMTRQIKREGRAA